MKTNTTSFTKITSASGYTEVYHSKAHGLLVLSSEAECGTCALVGGYCGQCSGSHFLPTIQLDKGHFCGYCHSDNCGSLYGDPVCHDLG